MTETEEVQKVVDLINDAKIAMVTTMDGTGKLVSRPLAVQNVEADGDMWFFTHRDTSQVTHVQGNPTVNVSFSQKGSWISVSGQGQVVEDRAKAKELWSAEVEAWFPDGPETPGLVFLRIDADSAGYWDTPGGAVTSAVQFIKSKTTGGKTDVGENKTVEL
ncbi:pyridoxamine 5'-phosphate oxidase family protein [Arthrobacter monumenti]